MKMKAVKTKSSKEVATSTEEPKTRFHSVKKWKTKFIYDLTKKEFLPIKGLFFLIYGANFALIPFLTLQARSLGITESEIGVIYSFIPVASLIAPTLSGMLADRIGNFKSLLSIATAISGITGLMFIMVPIGRVTHILPEQIPMEITCSSMYGSNMLLEELFICDVSRNSHTFQIDVLNCSLTCLENESLKEKNFENLLCEGSSNCFHPPEHEKQEYGLINQTTTEDVDVKFFNLHSDNRSYHFDTNESFSASIHFSRGSDHSIFYDSNIPICHNYAKQMVDEYESMNTRTMNKNCFTTCKAVTNRDNLCQNSIAIEELNPSLTFYSILLIHLLNEFTLAISIPLLEGAAVTILKEHNGDFGFQRMYTNVGMMVVTPISGTLIDYFSQKLGRDDFRPAISVYCGMKLSAAIVIMFLSLNFKQPSKKVVKEFSSMFIKPEIILFLVATFLAGTCYGFIETFLFWLLEDLGADKQFMGITVTVGSVFGIPLLMASTYIIKKLGHVNTIVFGFMIYIIRFTGYTLISNPWWAMPFEAMECMTVSLMAVAFVSYASILATPSTVVTLQGTYVGLYNGVGRGSGSLLGGYLIENVGTILTFRFMAAFGGLSGVFYFIAMMILFACRKRSNNSAKADVESANAEKPVENTDSVKHDANTTRSEPGLQQSDASVDHNEDVR